MRSELLGTVTAPSGRLFLVDLGLLGLWSHDREPEIPENSLPPETPCLSRSYRDFQVLGPDAEAASRIFGRSPGWIYDRPPNFDQVFAEKIAAAGLEAHLEMQEARVPHLERLERSLVASPWGVVEFHGVWGLAFADLPRDQSFELSGTRMGVGDFPQCWDQVSLRVRPEVEIARSEDLGTVPVDHARLAFLGSESLGAWVHEDAQDSLADFVFWGRDAEEAAAAGEAMEVEPGVYGWVDVPVRQAAELGVGIEALRDARRLKFATDFRPHSHHYQVLKRLRQSPTESATLEVGPGEVCAFMTSWGDGFFPVVRDLGPDDQLVGIRVLLGNEGSVRNMRAVNG